MRAIPGESDVEVVDEGPGPSVAAVVDAFSGLRALNPGDLGVPWPVAPAAVSQAPGRRRSWLRRLHARRASVGVVEMSVIVAGDLVAVALAVLIVDGPHLFLVLPAVALWLQTRLYSRRCHLSVLDDLPRLARGVVLASLVWVVCTGSRPREVAMMAIVLLSLVVLIRAVSYLSLRSSRVRGHLQLTTVVVGSGERAAWLLDRAQGHPEYGLKIIGVLGDGPAELAEVTRLGRVTDLQQLGVDHVVDAVILADATGSEETLLLDSLRVSAERHVDVLVMPRLQEVPSVAQDRVWGVPLYRLGNRRPGFGFAVKRASDVVGSGLLLVLVLPVLLLAALAIRIELGPGLLFRQVRIGKDGRRFELLKLRSMRDVGGGTVSAWAREADRMGRVGAFIRRYSVDELPQLVNVLRGDMSLVGPRPERPEYVEAFSQQIPSYPHRHRVPVGLTGLSAVQGLRGDTSIVERAHFDNWYIDNWSLWLDLKILVRTAVSVLRGTGR